jgi:hypothetical protein
MSALGSKSKAGLPQTGHSDTPTTLTTFFQVMALDRFRLRPHHLSMRVPLPF